MGPLFGAVVWHSVKGKMSPTPEPYHSVCQSPTLAPLGRGNHRFSHLSPVQEEALLGRATAAWEDISEESPIGSIARGACSRGCQAFCPGSRQQPPRETYSCCPNFVKLSLLSAHPSGFWTEISLRALLQKSQLHLEHPILPWDITQQPGPQEGKGRPSDSTGGGRAPGVCQRWGRLAPLPQLHSSVTV